MSLVVMATNYLHAIYIDIGFGRDRRSVKLIYRDTQQK
jgi:hypothetical protein